MEKQYFFGRILILLTVILLSSFSSNAQISKKINGTVTSTEGSEPLVGVNILVKGTTNGTITDMDGNYSIIASETDVLIFSFIGYVTQEITVGDQSSISVQLELDAENIDEVVVIGYGTAKKSHLTGAVSKVTNDNLEQIPVSSIDQVLSGRVAGLSIQNTTSEVGVAPEIRIRGMGSISASNEPLVVVDGYPVPDGLSSVDINDVESIEVLKDASSAAIYGSRGANGVILITTKSGEAEKPKYKFSAYTGFNQYIKLHPMMTSDEYGVFRMRERAIYNGISPDSATTDLLNVNERAAYLIAKENGNTNWQEEALRTAKINNYSLSVAGGRKNFRYYLSGNYINDQGIMKKSDYEKFSIQGKMTTKLNDRVTVSLTFNPSYSKSQRPRANFTDYMRNPSFMPVKHNQYTADLTGEEVGTYAFGRHFVNTEIYDPLNDATFIATNPWGTSNNSPAYIRDNEEYFNYSYRALTNSNVLIKILDNLNFSTSNGAYVKYSVTETYMNANSRREGQVNSGTYDNNLYVDLLSENTLNYEIKKGLHQINAILGATFQKTTVDVAGMEGNSFPTDYINTLNAATAFNLEETGTSKEEIALTSYLGRVNYAFRNKYLASLAIRADGSSLFGPENKWGWFPSASIGWRVTEEPFMNKIKSIYMLKLRASVGVTGNNDIENYAYQNTLVPANYQLGIGASNPTAGLAENNTILGNKAISWEQTIEYNYGMDISFFKGRLGGSLNYYYKITDQLLLKQEINSYSGYNQYWNNIGKVRNSGIEFELNSYIINNQKIKWKVNGNISANSNRLLELGGESQTIKQGERGEQYIAKVGEKSIQYYGYKMIGVWASQDEIDNNPSSEDDAPGGIRVADLNNDGKIDADDRTTLGSPFPDFTWGANSTLEFGNFDLSVLFEGVHGAKVLNGDGYYTETRRYNTEFNTGRWINEENPGVLPFERLGRNWVFTNYLIEDASYWCLRNINLGYTLSSTFCNKLHIESARFYVAAQNLLYFMNSDFRGINPEARTTSSEYSDPLIDGYQRGAFPLNRTYTIGVNLNF